MRVKGEKESGELEGEEREENLWPLLLVRERLIFLMFHSRSTE